MLESSTDFAVRALLPAEGKWLSDVLGLCAVANKFELKENQFTRINDRESEQIAPQSVERIIPRCRRAGAYVLATPAGRHSRNRALCARG